MTIAPKKRRRYAGRDRSRFHHHARARRARRWRRRNRGRRRELHRSNGLRCIRTGTCPRCTIRRPVAGGRTCIARCSLIEPPARWTPDKKASFATWPRDVQEAVVARNSELEADYTRKTQDAADLRRTAEPLLKAIKPFEAYLNELAPIIGQTPDTMIASLLGIEYQLRKGDPQKKAKGPPRYRCVLRDRSCGPQPWGTAGANYASGSPLPATASIIRDARTAPRADRADDRGRATAADRPGDRSLRHRDRRGRTSPSPALPAGQRRHGQLLRDDPALTLEAAYQKAIEPLQQAIAEELRVRQEAADRERQQTVEKARKVAPVKSSGSSPNGSAKAKDLDALLWDNINAKIA